MGAGFYSAKARALNLRVSFRFDASGQLDQWERAFTYASAALHHATQGLVRIASVQYVNDETSGDVGPADIRITAGIGTLHSGIVNGLSAQTGGIFEILKPSSVDAYVQIASDFLKYPGLLVHELGHYFFKLYDEYEDEDSNAAACIGDQQHQSTAGACIMQVDRNSIDLVPALPIWWQGPGPRITEWCVENNQQKSELSHNAGSPPPTHQHQEHGTSCWATILGQLGNPVPLPVGPIPPAAGSPVGEVAEVIFEKGDQFRRFALVLDRSGSMALDGGIGGVRHAAHTWIDLESLLGNELAVVAYNDEASLVVPSGTSAGDAHNAVSALGASGRTNVTKGLQLANSTLEVDGNIPPAAKHLILFSDGRHNEGPPYPNPGIAPAATLVHAVGFGDVDQGSLRSIKSTNGHYDYVPDTGNAATNELNINNAIAELAGETHSSMLARAEVALTQVFDGTEAGPSSVLESGFGIGSPEDLERVATLPSDEVAARPDFEDVTVEVDGGASRVTFVLNRRSVDTVFLYVLDPVGNPVEPRTDNFAIDDGHVTYSVVGGPAGEWTMRIRLLQLEGEFAPAIAFAFAEDRDLAVALTGPEQLYEVGDRVGLRAWAQASQLLSGVTVRAWPEGDPATVLEFEERTSGYHYLDLPPVEAPGSYRWVVEYRAGPDAQEIRGRLDVGPEIPEPKRPGPLRRIKRVQIDYGPLSRGRDNDDEASVLGEPVTLADLVRCLLAYLRSLWRKLGWFPFRRP